MSKLQTAVITGASRGIGAAAVMAFLDRGYNVVANARSFSSGQLTSTPQLVLVDGSVTDPAIGETIVSAGVKAFGSIDHVVNNAGAFFSKPFIEYTLEEFQQLTAINLAGFLTVTQSCVRQMIKQGRGGSVTTITAALADNPIASAPASVPMMTKGGLNSITLSLASEFAQQRIRFNAVAPGVVETALHAGRSRDFLLSRSPMQMISDPKEIASAVVFLAEASSITGEVLHVDGGAHVGKW